MDRDGTTDPLAGPPRDEVERGTPTTWVISPGSVECEHPADALRPLGEDGLNGYYRCDRCDAGLVVQDEVVRGV